MVCTRSTVLNDFFLATLSREDFVFQVNFFYSCPCRTTFFFYGPVPPSLVSREALVLSTFIFLGIFVKIDYSPQSFLSPEESSCKITTRVTPQAESLFSTYSVVARTKGTHSRGGFCFSRLFFRCKRNECRIRRWGFAHGAPVIVPRYTVHERALYFKSTLWEVIVHREV